MKSKAKKATVKARGSAFKKFIKSPAEKSSRSSETSDSPRRAEAPRRYGATKPYESSGRTEFRGSRDTGRPPARPYQPRETVEKKIIVPAERLRNGVQNGQEEINAFIHDICTKLQTNPLVKEVELALGFDSHGNFIGSGTGASATINVKVVVS